MSETTYSGPIVDSHCHIASTRFIPTAFLDGLCANVHARLAANGIRKSRAELLAAYLDQNQDHHGDALVADMTSGGIDQAVVLLPDFTYVMKTDLTIAEMYAEHRAILARHAGGFTCSAAWIRAGARTASRCSSRAWSSMASRG
ncbi:hypothetical protein B7760_00778 [Burkholderia glumae]|uniref:hypothetical protein n=1 Tax=Burkholderia glumae TaxID=337 RepID=UPI00157A967D|nr:hypothetical protein [Burkholderia glumae]QKM46777.1 hypothetical protein B7760_00778 [Burkholderia glumae]